MNHAADAVTSKDVELLVVRHEVPCCAAPIPGPGWIGPTGPCWLR